MRHASKEDNKITCFCKSDFKVWRGWQWWFCWLSWLDCNSKILRFWRAFSLEGRKNWHAWRSKEGALWLFGPQWSANEVWKFCYTGTLHRGIEIHRVEETKKLWKNKELPLKHCSAARGTKWFSCTSSERWFQEETQEIKTALRVGS